MDIPGKPAGFFFSLRETEEESEGAEGERRWGEGLREAKGAETVVKIQYMREEKLKNKKINDGAGKLPLRVLRQTLSVHLECFEYPT